MGWIFEGIERSEDERRYSDRELIQRSLKRLAPYRKPIIISSVTTILLTVISLLTPLIFGFLIQTLDASDLTEVSIVVVLFAGTCYLVLSVFSWLGDYTINVQVAKVVPFFMVTLRGDIFDALQKQDMKFFDKHRSGRLNSRVSSRWSQLKGTSKIGVCPRGAYVLTMAGSR